MSNYDDDEHEYEVHVYTGNKPHSGTDSNVRLVVAGTEGDTGARKLSDGKRKNFQTGDVNTFLLKTSHTLGVPAYIKISHDNSGKGKKAGWFLSKVVIVDKKDKQWYLFKCDKWLALDEDDGRMERIVRLSSEDDVASDDSLLSNNVSKSFWNDHIWLSIAYRQSRSSFTRVQRLSCCLAILFLTMVTNAMFYGTGGDSLQESAFSVGPISLTIQQLYTSIASSIIIVPPIVLITTFFSKSKPTASEKKQEMQEKEEIQKKKAAKKLPYWCNYVAWVLVFLCIACGAFFTILYALQWGKPKSEAWLLTFVLSFFQSLLLVQPIKVRTIMFIH